MSLFTHLTRRVLARHMAAAVVLRSVPAPTVEVILGDGGIVTGRDIARLLEDRVGTLLKVRFRRSLSGMPNTVAWEAVDERGEIVTGQVLVHAGVREDQVVAWAEVVVSNDHAGGRIAATGTPEERLLRARLERIAHLARRLVEDARVQPQKPSVALVEDLVRIVDQAEYA